MKLLKTYRFLAPMLLAQCLEAVEDKLPEQDFEAFLERGFSEFVDKFSQGDFVSLGFETPAERRERSELITLWGFGIDKSLKHIEDLERQNLTCRELLLILENIKIYYTPEKQVEACCEKYSDFDKCRLQKLLDHDEHWQEYKKQKDLFDESLHQEMHVLLGGHPSNLDLPIRSPRKDDGYDSTRYLIARIVHDYSTRAAAKAIKGIKENIAIKIKNYQRLTGGLSHPLLEEFRKM